MRYNKHEERTKVFFACNRDNPAAGIVPAAGGKAFQPDQRFENTDGSDIIFNFDYFGKDRGVMTIAGPFAEAKEEYTL